MGFTFRRAINLEQEAVERVGDLAGLSSDALEALLSWTGTRVGNARMNFRGELFVSRALRNPLVRGCPVCLREDTEISTQAPIEVMAMRGDWQFREVSLCLRHSHVLVPLWEASTLMDRLDGGSHLAEINTRIRDGSYLEPNEEANDFDRWLDQRLDNGTDSTWLAGHSLFAATTVCRLLGGELLRRDGAGTVVAGSTRRAAQSIGFQVLRAGEAEFRNALDQLAAASKGAQTELKEAFGRLFEKLGRDYVDDPAFGPFREILRECILDNWALPAGATVLGQIIQERRLHSVHTAALQIGVRPVLLERFLIEAGAFSADDPRPHNRKVFDADRYAELLAEIPTLVGVHEMRTAMGATRDEFASLAEGGVLLPRTRNKMNKSQWRLSDGLALVAELEAESSLVDQHDPSFESVQWSQRRTSLRVEAIIAAIRERQIRVFKRTGIPGYTGFVVSRTEIDEHRRVSQPSMLLATEFGRRVGLRHTGRFSAFLAAGHTPATFVGDPTTGVERAFMTDTDVAAFHRRFMTHITISKEFGEHRNTIRMRLRDSGVAPFRADGEDYGPVYLRQSVEAVYARRGA